MKAKTKKIGGLRPANRVSGCVLAPERDDRGGRVSGTTVPESIVFGTATPVTKPMAYVKVAKKKS